MKITTHTTYDNNDPENPIASRIFVCFDNTKNEREGRYRIIFDDISNEFTLDEIKVLHLSLSELLHDIR